MTMQLNESMASEHGFLKMAEYLSDTVTEIKIAGTAWRDITPRHSQFLYGYPHVERMSTGVHDPLLSSALYLHDGTNAVMFIAVDVICLSKEHVDRARRRINQALGIAPENILISATHTHSGPVTIKMVSNVEDPIVPQPDPEFLEFLIDGIVDSGMQAADNARPAELGWELKKVDGLGTNRHDPNGPRLPEVPVLIARSTENHELIGVMCVCAMHPTVLHEDSTLYSGDFPGCARQYLRDQLGNQNVCVVYHMGTAGNQSPRHVVEANTFAEAKRLGRILGQALFVAIDEAVFKADWHLDCKTTNVILPRRVFPSVEQAENNLQAVARRLTMLQESKADRAKTRTAECDWFGAQETLTLARAQTNGNIEPFAQSCMPAEIQIITVGPWAFIGWPGEIFVEFGLEIRRRFPHAFIITLANGELQGYLVTAEAVERQAYEASNALFASPESPQLLVATTLQLIEKAL